MDSRLRNKFARFLSRDRILNNTKNINGLSVALKHSDLKGVGLYARRPIRRGETVAYYRIKIFNAKTYVSPTNYIYAFTIHNDNQETIDDLIGDIDFNSPPPPVNGVPFWGPFINEPSKNQIINVRVDLDSNPVGEDVSNIYPGDTITYKFVSVAEIPEGDEITWYYGESYHRNYPIDRDRLISMSETIQNSIDPY